MAAFNVNNYYTTFFRRVQQIFAYFDKIAIFGRTRRSSTQNRAAFFASRRREAQRHASILYSPEFPGRAQQREFEK
jgi:hypothetical protein